MLCAGVLSTSTFDDLVKLQECERLVDEIFRVNTFSFILATMVFLESLKKSRGQIIVINSVAGLYDII